MKFSRIILLATLLAGCGNIDLYEKTVTVPGHSWESRFVPSFDFELTDSNQVYYEVFAVLRHTEKYRYNNLYINLRIQGPGQDTALLIRRELQLANNEQWLGEGMDDIYEHRIPIGRLGEASAVVPGTYQISLEQIMREDPLEHVLDIGIRVEKKIKPWRNRTEEN
jgi:gliding motility-associated lipoprotein GldH